MNQEYLRKSRKWATQHHVDEVRFFHSLSCYQAFIHLSLESPTYARYSEWSIGSRLAVFELTGPSKVRSCVIVVGLG